LHHVEEIARSDVRDELLGKRADRERQVLDRRVDAGRRNRIAGSVALVSGRRDLKFGERDHFFAGGTSRGGTLRLRAQRGRAQHDKQGARQSSAPEGWDY
jgi:hypothetical protein